MRKVWKYVRKMAALISKKSNKWWLLCTFCSTNPHRLATKALSKTFFSCWDCARVCVQIRWSERDVTSCSTFLHLFSETERLARKKSLSAFPSLSW
jgi:hypothetical protein